MSMLSLEETKKRHNLRIGFADYFHHPVMWLCLEKSNKEWVVYMARIHSYLLNENRFVIVMVHRSHPQMEGTPPDKMDMKYLEWTILQTRNLQDYEKYLHLPKHTYIVEETTPFCRHGLSLVHSSEEYSAYKTPFLFMELHLLHKRKGSTMEYATRGTFGTALETYQAIFMFLTPEVTEKNDLTPEPSSNKTDYKIPSFRNDRNDRNVSFLV